MPVLRLRNFVYARVDRCLMFFVLPMVVLTMTASQQPVAREYEIKAVFLFNFTQFVEWPADAFASPDEPFVIGVVGGDPFGSFLDETVAGEFADTHPIVVKRFASAAEVSKCHILYVFLNNRQSMRQVLNSVLEKPVLTVSDVSDFSRMGGMVYLFTDGGRVRLRINLASAEKARLAISSKLLQLAEITQSGTD